MTKSVSEFDSSDTAVPDRPVALFDIAGREYELRCPKMRVWMGVLERQEDYDSGQVLKPHLQEIYVKLAGSPSDEERDKLLAQLGAIQPVMARAPSVLQLASFLLDFLVACITDPAQRQSLSEAYNSDDGPVDIPHLRMTLDRMDTEFSDWLDEQADLVGVQRPELPERPAQTNRAARRSSAKPGAATVRKPARAAKRTPARAA